MKNYPYIPLVVIITGIVWLIDMNITGRFGPVKPEQFDDRDAAGVAALGCLAVSCVIDYLIKNYWW